MRENGLHALLQPVRRVSPRPRQCFGDRVLLEAWLRDLGHPQVASVRQLLDAVVALGVMAPTGPHPTEVQVDLKVDGEIAYSALLDVAEWGGELRSVGIDTAFDQYSDPSTRSRRSAFAIAEQGSVVTVECADPRLKAYALLEVAEGWAK